MNHADIKTGDVILFWGGSNIASEVIESLTGSYCHVGLFFIRNGAPWVAEMYNDYREISLVDRLAEGGTSTPCWGMSPEVIRQQPDAVTAAMGRFFADASDLEYDYATLVRVWASDTFGAKFDAGATGPVCSVYVQRIFADVLKGDFSQLWSPSDVAKLCQSVMPIA